MSAICNIESTKIMNGSGMMRGASNLVEWDSDLPLMQYGSMAFHCCDHLESFKGNLNSLSQACDMFYHCFALDTFYVDMPNLIDGRYMFRECSEMTSFKSSLDKMENGYDMFLHCSYLNSFSAPYLGLVNGQEMFYHCSSLEHFSGDLSKLKTGWKMFGDEYNPCNLSIESVENIADSIQDIRDMSRDSFSDWHYYYYMGSTLAQGNIYNELRGVITLTTNSQVDGDRLYNAIRTIQGKGWDIVCNGIWHYYSSAGGSSNYYDIVAGSKWIPDASNWNFSIQQDIKSMVNQVNTDFNNIGFSYLYSSSSSSTFCRIEPSLIENGSYLFQSFTNLWKFYGSLSSLVEGTHMFNRCSSLYNFNNNLSQADRDKTLASLVGGYYMFAECAFDQWTVDLPSLTGAEGMFMYNRNLTKFDADLSSLQIANNMSGGGVDLSRGMFLGCENLSHFRGNLVSLLNGTGMFTGCSLDAASIQDIANTINNLVGNTNWTSTYQYYGEHYIDLADAYYADVRGRIDIGWNNVGNIGDSLAIMRAKGWNVYLNGTQVTDDWMATNYPNATVPDELPSGTPSGNPAYNIVEGSAYIPNANNWDDNLGKSIKVSSVQNGIAYYN